MKRHDTLRFEFFSFGQKVPWIKNELMITVAPYKYFVSSRR